VFRFVVVVVHRTYSSPPLRAISTLTQRIIGAAFRCCICMTAQDAAAVDVDSQIYALQ